MTILRETSLAIAVLVREADRAVLWRLVAAIVLSICGGALAALSPLALKALVDAVAQPGLAGAIAPDTSPWRSFPALVLAYLGAQCLVRVLAELRPVLVSAAEQRLLARLRERYFAQLLRLPLSFHLERRAGAQLHELQHACAGYQVLLFHCVNSVVPVLVETSVVMAVLALLGQPALTATIAAATVAYLVVMCRRASSLHGAAVQVGTSSAEVQAQLAEGLMNYEPIKCFGAERQTIDAFKRAGAALEQHWRLLQRQRLRRGAAVIGVFAATVGAVLALASASVLQGSLTVGGFVLVNLYMMQLVRPLEALCAAVRDVSQAVAFARPLLSVLEAATGNPRRAALASPADRASGSAATPASPCPAPDRPAPPPLITEPASAASSPPALGPHASPSVIFRGIEVSLGNRVEILKGLDLDIPAGCTTGIVGASGGGKSTLARLLLRLHTPHRGRIFIGGVDLDTLADEAVRRLVALVPQEVMLMSTSVASNIALGRAHVSPGEIERAARLAGIHAFIAALPRGYDTPIGERGLKLSGGERQRLAIARAILKDPRIFVLDEATSMLDATTEAQILQNLRSVCAGRTTLVIAHRLSAVRHADQIAVLEGGRVVEQGDHVALMARGGRYAALWHAQNDPQGLEADIGGEPGARDISAPGAQESPASRSIAGADSAPG